MSYCLCSCRNPTGSAVASLAFRCMLAIASSSFDNFASAQIIFSTLPVAFAQSKLAAWEAVAKGSARSSRTKKTCPRRLQAAGVGALPGRRRPEFWSVRRTAQDGGNKETGCRPKKAGFSMASLFAQGGRLGNLHRSYPNCVTRTTGFYGCCFYPALPLA